MKPGVPSSQLRTWLIRPAIAISVVVLATATAVRDAPDEAARSPCSSAEIKGGILWVRHPPSDGQGFRLRLHGGTPVRVVGEIAVPPAAVTSSRRTASPRR
jgi:hypothetical protein